MKRALELDDTPGLSVPLRFLLSAPWFGLAAGLLLAWHGEAALATRWSPVTVALTHLVTLGFLGMTMAGALLQMLPVVAGFAVPRGALAARAGWPMLGAGTVLLASALLSGVQVLFFAAVAALAVPFVMLFGAMAIAVARRAPSGSGPMVAGMRLALASLFITFMLGGVLAAFLGGQVSVPALELTDVHAAWGLLGWVLMLVLAVAYQVIPMFQATPEYPKYFSWLMPPALAVAIAAWTAARLSGAAWTPYAAAALAACVGAFAIVTLALLARRRRPAADVTTLYWRLSMGSLAACVLAYLLLPESALLVGAVFIAGFAMGAVNGMLYKIVPFLLWYHLQQQGVPKGRMVGAQQWIADGAARVQFWLHFAAVLLLAAATAAPGLFAHAAGLALCASCGKLGADLCSAALRYRRIARESALERA